MVNVLLSSLEWTCKNFAPFPFVLPHVPLCCNNGLTRTQRDARTRFEGGNNSSCEWKKAGRLVLRNTGSTIDLFVLIARYFPARLRCLSWRRGMQYLCSGRFFCCSITRKCCFLIRLLSIFFLFAFFVFTYVTRLFVTDESFHCNHPLYYVYLCYTECRRVLSIYV